MNTISPCRLMSSHLAGDRLLGGGIIAMWITVMWVAITEGLYNKRVNEGTSTER
jgi:hypothetical protein